MSMSTNTRRLKTVAQIMWFRSKWNSPVFELRLDQRTVMAAEHPSLIAAALHTSGVEFVEFANVEGKDRRDYITNMPVGLDDLPPLQALAGDDAELAAALTIITASLIYLADMHAAKKACGDLPTVLNHHHAACLLLPPEHVVNRPHLGVPVDWAEWLWHRLQHTYFPAISTERAAQMGAVEPPPLEIPEEYSNSRRAQLPGAPT